MKYLLLLASFVSLNLLATDLIDQTRQDNKIQQQKIDNQRVENAQIQRQQENRAYEQRLQDNARYERQLENKRYDDRRWDRAHGRWTCFLRANAVLKIPYKLMKNQQISIATEDEFHENTKETRIKRAPKAFAKE